MTTWVSIHSFHKSGYSELLLINAYSFKNCHNLRHYGETNKLGVPLKDRLDITYYVVGYIGLIMFLSSFYRASAYIHTHYGIIKLILV